MPKALSMSELESSVCSCGGEDCDSTTVYFHSRCHPEDGTWASYTKGEGKLVIRCKTCNSLIAEVAVSSAN
jgi:hypothetical protein